MAHSEAGAAVSVERFFQFSMLGLVTSGYLAVAGSGYLDVATVALTAAGLLLRAVLIAGLLDLRISERATTLITLSYIGFFGLDYFVLSRDFLAATVHLVFFLAVMKILTASTMRDYLYTAIIAFLELLAAAILSVNLNFFWFLGLFLLCAVGALTSGEIRRSLVAPVGTARGFKRFPAQLGLLSAAVTVGVLVLTAGLFFLLPRTADAAFSRLLAHRVYLPGFSDQVTLGEYGEIKTSSRPVMHVSIFSRTVPPGLKWRGGALAHFDGKRWSNPDPHSEAVPVENGDAALDAGGPARSGRQMNYQVQLEAVDTDALFLAGVPEKIAVRRPFLLFRNDTGGIHLNRIPPVGFRYEVRSLLEDPPETAPPPDRAVVLGLARRNRYLQLPPLDPRIPQLARNMTQGATTDLERSRALERRLRSDYGYTLELPSHEIADPLAYFLFQKKKGYCEYFASAMAVMLRSLGIPARLATGFLTGEYNPISGLWLVRASDAHAWVEAWIPGYGWTTFDPTPPDLNPPTFSLLTQLGLYLDASQTFWQEWVVGYDIGRQGVLTDRLQQGVRRMGIRWFDSLTGLESDDWKAQVGAWGRRFGGGAASVLSLGALLWLLGPPLIRRLRLRRRVSRVRRGRAATGDATLLYGRMLHILKRRGYQKPPWFTPAEFAASLPRTPLGLSVAEFTDTYNAWRFGGRTDVAPRLSTLLDELERQES